MRAWNWIGFGFYLFFVTAGVAGPLEDGNAALAKGDYFTAFKALSPLGFWKSGGHLVFEP
jgi:hypothetical protein